MEPTSPVGDEEESFKEVIKHPLGRLLDLCVGITFDEGYWGWNLHT